MRVRELRDADWDAWLRMSLALFPEHSAPELEQGMREHCARADGAVFVAESGDGVVCGFVEVGSRPYADGCDSSPVGYVEAWFVEPAMRKQGWGLALLAAAEEWARRRGYAEIASDTRLDNLVSQQAHGRGGYKEVGRIVQYRKLLG
ncbi:MAG: GNAT family N-acetyltransferase [Gemmatimonadota bacterium]|nr:GNAT family N-acetyltransferase [Gemmatimonadota bacterium]